MTIHDSGNHLASIYYLLSRMDTNFYRLESKLDGQAERMRGIEMDVSALKQASATTDQRVGSLERNFDAMKAEVKTEIKNATALSPAHRLELWIVGTVLATCLLTILAQQGLEWLKWMF